MSSFGVDFSPSNFKLLLPSRRRTWRTNSQASLRQAPNLLVSCHFSTRYLSGWNYPGFSVWLRDVWFLRVVKFFHMKLYRTSDETTWPISLLSEASENRPTYFPAKVRELVMVVCGPYLRIVPPSKKLKILLLMTKHAKLWLWSVCCFHLKICSAHFCN